MTAALEELHRAHQARFGTEPGLGPLDYGDFAAEVETIRTGMGVLDGSGAGVIVVRGPDATIFLNGITTNDVKRLADGQVQPNLLCANKGKILFEVDVLRVQAEQYVLLTHPGELDGVAGHLDGYHIREAVEIGRVPLLRIDLLGPRAEAALSALGHSAARPIGTFRGAPLLTPAYPLGGLPRVLALVPEPNAQVWVEALLAAEPTARLVGEAAFEELRIRAGTPRFGVDFGREHLPAEAGLHDHLSFNKGCYVGQEVHARLHHRGHVNRKLGALRLPEATAAHLEPGADLFADGQLAAVLTSLARLPVEGARAGIALVRYEPFQAGKPLAAAPDGPADIAVRPLATDLGAARA